MNRRTSPPSRGGVLYFDLTTQAKRWESTRAKKAIDMREGNAKGRTEGTTT